MTYEAGKYEGLFYKKAEKQIVQDLLETCLLYTSDAADDHH